MEELEALRKLIEEQDYSAALALIDEMDEMAKDDKITKVESFLEVLLIHLIKQHVEQRSTSSWERSIKFSVRGIRKSNKRRSAGGSYLKPEELRDAVDESFDYAVDEASHEAFGGAFEAKKLAQMIDAEAIKQQALELILNYDPQN